MSRAVILGTNAYPHLIRYWLYLFENVWGDEVDRVHIAVSEPIHKSAWAYISKMLTKNEKIKVYLTHENWPESIRTVINQIDDDYLFIPHDDLLIFEKGVVDKYFKMVEDENKVVTPLHDNYTPKPLLDELMQKKWNHLLPLKEDGTDRTGYSFYCNFFFISRKLLKSTSMNFGEYSVKRGEHSELLDWTPLTLDISADTNYRLGLELFNNGAQFHCPREYDFRQYLPVHFNQARGLESLYKDSNLFEIPYLHLQTLAYHIEGLFADYGYYEGISKIRGSEPPRNIENIPISQASQNDVLFKVAFTRLMIDKFDWSGVMRYNNYIKSEIDFAIKYMGIKKNDFITTYKYLNKLLWR